MRDKQCLYCGFYDEDYEGCSCPSYDRWYACPLEPEPTAEDFMTVGELKRLKKRRQKQKRGDGNVRNTKHKNW